MVCNVSNLFSDHNLHAEWKSYEEELSSKGKQHKNLQHIFRKHVKPKKQHEIARLGSLVKSISESTKISQIVDIGSGVGHLSRLLAYAHSLKTVSIDSKENYVESAQIFDDQLVQQLKKKDAMNQDKNSLSKNTYLNNDSSKELDTNAGPQYLEKHIDFNDRQAFLQLLSSYHNGKYARHMLCKFSKQLQRTSLDRFGANTIILNLN